MATPAAVLNILVRANSAQAIVALKAVDTQAKKSAGIASAATGRMGKVAAASGLAAAAGIGYAINKAADYEQQLSSLEAVTNSNSRQMGRLRDQSMKAGAATKYSALEAAQAQTELAKGGLKVGQILSGGLDSALALAAAGEMDLAEAAATTVNSMKLFGLEGRASMKVANALATAANTTTADVSDFALALKMGGSVAKMAGADLNETVTVLEALAEAGIKGSDAGTSMKSFFLNIATPTEKSLNLMKDLGMSIFDAEGNLKSIPAVAENLRHAFGDLTKEQFLAKAGTIAGSDAIRALYSIYDAGPGKLRRLQKANADQTSALDTAAKKQDNFRGKLENLQGSVETIAIAFGSKLLPELSKAAEELTDVLGNPKLTSEEKISKAAEVFGELVGKGIDEGIDAASEGGPKIIGALADSMFGAWRDMNPFAKLLTAAVIVRAVGGPGALTATGKAIGNMLGAGVGSGVAAGMASGASSGAAAGIASALAGGAAGGAAGQTMSKFGKTFEKTASGILVPAGESAGKVGGTAAGSKFMSTMRGKVLPIARNVGLAGVGIALVDGVMREFGKRAAERSPDLIERLNAMADDSSFLGGETWFGGNRGDKNAQKLVDVYKQLGAERTKISQADLNDLVANAHKLDLTKRQRAEVSRTLTLLQQGRNLGIKVDLGMDPSKLKRFEGGFQKLRAGVYTSMGDITRVSQRNMAIVRNVLGTKTAEGRKLAADNMRATARAIDLQMIRSGDRTKAGMARVAKLIREADLLSPTRTKAREFGRAWASGMTHGNVLTKKGMDGLTNTVIREAGKMPAPMRKIALQTWNSQITAAVKAKRISKTEAQDMRSKVQAAFSGLELSSRSKSKRTADAVIRNNQRMTNVSSNAFGVLVENANSALSAFGVVKKLEYKAKKFAPDKKQQGGFIVPGAGSGDTFQTSVPAGSFVLNREATKAFGFQKGGLARVALEPGERVFMPDEVQRIGHKTLHAANKAVPRFQNGGIVGIPWAPGEEVAASILPLLTRLHKKFGFTVTDAFDRDRSAGHKSPGHNVSGTAVDVVGGDLAGLVRWAVAKGLTTYWNGGSGATPLAGHDDHAHIEFGGAGALLAAAMEKLARITLDGPAGPLRDMGQGALDKVRQAGDRMLAKHAMVSGSGDLFAPFGGLQGLGGNAAANRALGQKMAERVGWVGAQWAALDHLWGVDESGWDETVANKAGSGAYGIAQALPSSKYPPAGRPEAPNGPDKAKAQIAWGLQYIRDRYGDPLAADAFRHANNWYQLGGLVKKLAKGGPIGMVGDSLGEGTEGPLRAMLTGRKLIANNARNRTSAQGVSLFGGLGKVAQYVFDLGTNDGTAGALRSSLRSVSRIAGDKPIHALTVRSPYEPGPKNEMLRQLAGRGKDGVGNLNLIPWASIAGNYTGSDPQGIHPNGAGYSKRASMIHDSIQKAAKAAERAKEKGKGGDDKAKAGTPFEKSLDKAMGIARKTPTVKNRRKTRKALRRALKIIEGLGIDAKQKELKQLTDQADKYGEYATNAQSLTIDDGDGNQILGLFQGKDEGHWLNQQLETLMTLRAKLLNAEKLVSEEKPKAERLLNEARERLRKVQAALEHGRRRKAKLEADLRKLEKQLDHLQKKPKVNKAAIDAAKAKVKDIKGDLGTLDKAQKQRGRVRDLLGGENGVVKRIEKKRSALNTLQGNLLGDGGDRGWKGLAVVQGVDGPMEKMKTAPAMGVLGGEILTAQKALADFGRKPDVSADTSGDSGSVDNSDLLELLRRANQRTLVANSLFPVIRDFQNRTSGMLPYGGTFHGGGIVAGRSHQERMAVVKGREGVFTEEQMAALAPVGAGGIDPSAIQVVVNGDIVSSHPDPVELLVNDRRFKVAVKNVMTRAGRKGGV